MSGSPLGLSFKLDINGRPEGFPSADPKKGGTIGYQVIEGKAVESLFGGAQFSPYPSEGDINKESGSVTKMSTAGQVHNDGANEITIQSIIEYTKQYNAMKLDYSHFAYLKNVGVYPNNRLIIARRFAGAVGNDLTAQGTAPMATLISYVKEEQDDFFSISFNEEWEDAAGGFEDILNEIGEDMKLSSDQKGSAGKMVSAAFNFVPMPALMEGVQTLIKQKLGLAGAGQGPGASPYGNPNLIRQAKQRKVLPKGEAGSALTAKFSIDMVIEYEQKFINGVDPTLVYMDILQNALTFGTSDSAFEYSSAFAKGTTDIIGKLISGDIEGIVSAIKEFITALADAITKVATDLIDKLIDPDEDEDAEESETPNADKKAAYIASFTAGVKEFFSASVGTVISKYKIRLLGVANALSGSNSTPWHVTIGNPKKPIFSSGDMQCTSVTVSLGKVLAFNDLPSTIKIEIKLENARNMGAQEIFNRFNTGRGRSYKRYQKSFVEADEQIQEQVKKLEIEEKNKEKNADTQKPTAKVETDGQKLQNSGGTQPSGTKPPSESVGSTNDVKDKQGQVSKNVDDYDVQGGGLTTTWGQSTYLVSPPPPPKPIEQQGTASVTNDAKTVPSEQSANDPKTTTAGVAATSNATNTTPNSTIPGVTQSASTLQQQQAAGVTGSQAPEPESLPAPIPEPEPRRDEEPEIVLGPDGKPTVVYPPGTTPTDTPAQTQQTTAEGTAQTNQPAQNTDDDVKSELQREEKIKAYYASTSVEDHKRMIGHYTELINALDRSIEYENEQIVLAGEYLTPNLAADEINDIKSIIAEKEFERNSYYEQVVRHQTELKNKQ